MNNGVNTIIAHPIYRSTEQTPVKLDSHAVLIIETDYYQELIII